MDGPTPPRDDGLRNVIDKLAEFVARNGPEFEMVTKQKQLKNPKFDFLYGGEFANYYHHKVKIEQNLLQQQQVGQGLQSLTTQQNVSQSQLPANPFASPLPTMLQNQQSHLSNSFETNSFGNSLQPNNLWGITPTQQPQQPNGNALALNYTAQIEAINIQQSTLRDQIHQSESNLNAQHTALVITQNKQIESAIEAAQNETLDKQAEDNNISLKEFDSILQPIMESCTKDSISAGKNWILQHSTDSAKNIVVLQYLLKKALVNGSTFQHKLHLIYLVNDILHHCVRKSILELKNSIENVVIPMFCSADLIATEDQRVKLTKLLSLWESKAKFFDACVISKLQSSDSSMKEYKTNLQNQHHEVVTEFTQATKLTMENYQKQHKLFVQHATQQITQLEQQKQQLEQQMLASVLPNAATLLPPSPQSNKIPSLMSQKIIMPQSNDETSDHVDATGIDNFNGISDKFDHLNANSMQQQIPNSQAAMNNFNSDGTQRTTASNFFIPDLSKPPPGFLSGLNTGIAAQIPTPLQQQLAQLAIIPTNAPTDTPIATSNINVDLIAVNAALQLMQQHQLNQQQQLEQPKQQTVEDNLPVAITAAQTIVKTEDNKPAAAYYDLPAGLMVPLIRLEDFRYRPLDPTDIRLPPPAPQSERLTNALQAFYDQPTHDRPRDTEGWEKLGLYEYYKVKNAARKQKEDNMNNTDGEKSRSPTPIVFDKPKPKKVNKRCYRSKSRSRSKSPQRSSPRRSRSRSRSRSPTVSLRRDNSNNRPSTSSSSRNNNSSNNSNRFRQRSRSPRRSSPRIERDRERDRSNIRRERERSITPPSFLGSNFAKPEEFIAETNKGHQMLMKMGWAGSGTGLGSKSQGIDQPISSGEVRDRKDLYKGVGVNLNDPYENFRKTKGVAFVHRMRARDEKI